VRIKRSDNERLVVVHFPLLLAVAGLAPAVISLVVICGAAAGRIHWAKGQPIWSSPACVVLFALLWGAVFSIFVRKNTFNFDLMTRKRYGYDLAQAKQFVDGLTKQAARERDRG